MEGDVNKEENKDSLVHVSLEDEAEGVKIGLSICSSPGP